MHAVDERGKAVLRKQLRREQVASLFVNLPPCLVGIEACSSADPSLGPYTRALRARGTVDGAAGREAVREGEQERWGRRGGDLRGGESPEHALRADQEYRAARRSSCSACGQVVRARTGYPLPGCRAGEPQRRRDYGTDSCGPRIRAALQLHFRQDGLTASQLLAGRFACQRSPPVYHDHGLVSRRLGALRLARRSIRITFDKLFASCLGNVLDTFFGFHESSL